MREKILLFIGLGVVLVMVVFGAWAAIISNSYFFPNWNISKLTTQNRDLSEFNEIEVSGDINVDITQSENQKVEIQSGENKIDLIKTEVVDQKLKIYTDNLPQLWRTLDFSPVAVKIDVKKLLNLNTSGKVNVKLSAINGEKLQIQTSGISQIDGRDLDINQLVVDMSGAGNVEFFGKARNLDAKLTGASDLKLSSLKVDTAKVNISGAGNANLDVTELLNVTVSGAGDVRYTGNPKVIQDVSGAGSVSKD